MCITQPPPDANTAKERETRGTRRPATWEEARRALSTRSPGRPAESLGRVTSTAADCGESASQPPVHGRCADGPENVLVANLP